MMVQAASEQITKELRKALFLLNAAYLPYRFLDSFLDCEPSNLWKSGEPFWTQLCFPDGVKKRLRDMLDDNWVEKEVEMMRRYNVRFVSIVEDSYPEKLRNIEKPPIGLYVRGEFEPQAETVGIVGTRRCSRYGASIAESLGKMLAGVNVAVISGGAVGIDTHSHIGCLNGGGKTIAVLGTGIDVTYPERNRELFEAIVEKGALVSEFPFGVHADAWRFPARNRIVMGMSDRIVVVEAPMKSGAMITARLAIESGREVWAVPGPITDSLSLGTNMLLRDGANVMYDIADFVETITGIGKGLFPDFVQGDTEAKRVVPDIQLSSEEKKLVAVLYEKGGRTVDELVAISGLTFTQVQVCLATLTISSLVIADSPGRFSVGYGVRLP